MSSRPNHKLLTRVALSAVASALLVGAPLSQGYAAELKSILFVNPLPQYPAWRLIGDCIAKEAKANNIAETEAGPTGALNTTVMIQQIQQGIANSPGAIITFPASDGFAPILQQARDAGIRTATLYGGGGKASGAEVNVGANFTKKGGIYAEALADREGPQNVGLMVLGPTGPGKAFNDGFVAAAAKTKNVKVIAVVYTNDDAAKALDQANALLAAHPEINVIASHMGTATQGATSAIRAKELVGKVAFLANGTAGGGREGLADGTVYKLMLQDLCTAGTQVVDSLIKLNNGETVPEQLDVGLQMFRAEGIQEYLDKGWQ